MTQPRPPLDGHRHEAAGLAYCIHCYCTLASLPRERDDADDEHDLAKWLSRYEAQATDEWARWTG